MNAERRMRNGGRRTSGGGESLVGQCQRRDPISAWGKRAQRATPQESGLKKRKGLKARTIDSLSTSTTMGRAFSPWRHLWTTNPGLRSLRSLHPGLVWGRAVGANPHTPKRNRAYDREIGPTASTRKWMGISRRVTKRLQMRRRRTNGFVLLEVILSLTILGIAVTAFMRSFNQSAQATRLMTVQTQAQFFARQLMEEFEISPPFEGEHEGGFGDDYREYYWRATVIYEEPDYGGDLEDDNVKQFNVLRLLDIEIHYDNGRSAPWVPVRVETAIVNYERFTKKSKQSYGLF